MAIWIQQRCEQAASLTHCTHMHPSAPRTFGKALTRVQAMALEGAIRVQVPGLLVVEQRAEARLHLCVRVWLQSCTLTERCVGGWLHLHGDW